MKYSRTGAGLIASIVLIAACSTNKEPTLGDRMISEAAGVEALGDQWNRGNQLVTDGEKLLKKGRERLEKGRREVTEGEQMVIEGKRLMQESEREFNRRYPAGNFNRITQ